MTNTTFKYTYKNKYGNHPINRYATRKLYLRQQYLISESQRKIINTDI